MKRLLILLGILSLAIIAWAAWLVVNPVGGKTYDLKLTDRNHSVYARLRLRFGSAAENSEWLDDGLVRRYRVEWTVQPVSTAAKMDFSNTKCAGGISCVVFGYTGKQIFVELDDLRSGSLFIDFARRGRAGEWESTSEDSRSWARHGVVEREGD